MSRFGSNAIQIASDWNGPGGSPGGWAVAPGMQRQGGMKTFAIARSPRFAWLLALFGATADRAQVRLHPDSLDVEFGPFHERLPLSEVVGVEVAYREVPWWRRSLGWRTDLVGTVALVGRSANLVRLTLEPARRVRVFPWAWARCRELLVSLEEPDAFVAAVRSAQLRRA